MQSLIKYQELPALWVVYSLLYVSSVMASVFYSDFGVDVDTLKHARANTHIRTSAATLASG